MTSADHSRNPYCIDALAKLPSSKSIPAAYHLEIAVDFVRGKGLDLAVVLRLNKRLDAFHLPAPLFLHYASFVKAFQAVIEKSRSGVRDDSGRADIWFFRVDKRGQPA